MWSLISLTVVGNQAAEVITRVELRCHVVTKKRPLAVHVVYEQTFTIARSENDTCGFKIIRNIRCIQYTVAYVYRPICSS